MCSTERCQGMWSLDMLIWFAWSDTSQRDRSPNMGRRKFAGGPVEDAIEWEDAYDEVKEQNRSLEAACR